MWSHIRNLSFWKSTDLDKILIEGDKLYKSLNVIGPLDVDDIPRSITMSNISCSVTLLNLETCVANINEGYPLLQIPFSTRQNNDNSGLIIIDGYTIAVFQLPDGKFYVFDSHSRDERGLSVFDGKSCLLKFKNIYEVEKYIQVHYLEYRERESTYFQLQFLEIEIPVALSLSLSAEFVQSNKRNTMSQVYQRLSPFEKKEKHQLYYQLNKEKYKAKYKENKEKRQAAYKKNK